MSDQDQHASDRNQYLQPAPDGYAVRDSGDAWVTGPDGSRYWGRFGAAGLLAHDTDRGILMQHRVAWSHFGGTWGIPGGARREGETALQAALREAGEEAGVPSDAIAPISEHSYDLGFWSYVTVLARVTRPFDAVRSDAESVEVAWVPLTQVAGLELHPGFAKAWPELQRTLLERQI
ncbi:NUDIX hydrolase [Pseudoclavibacter sp. 13-3]|uniref:NUDIX hydrolase n=1 Tax=Pseudoclavibacter sp. 13-3 TaxID=2901228 RepID=UPI002F909C13